MIYFCFKIRERAIMVNFNLFFSYDVFYSFFLLFLSLYLYAYKTIGFKISFKLFAKILLLYVYNNEIMQENIFYLLLSSIISISRMEFRLMVSTLIFIQI